MPGIEERQWKGLFTNLSPHDLPQGFALVQNNLQVVKHGVLRCRRGIVPLGWYTPVGSQLVIALARFDPLVADLSYLVYELGNGNLNAASDGAVTGIFTGLHTQYVLSMVRSRQGWLFGFNGIDQGIRWNGVTTSASLVGITPPSAVPTVSLSGGGGLSKGNYQWAYRWKDPAGVWSALSPATANIAATANQSASVTCTCSTQSRIGTVEVWRTTVAEATTFYFLGTAVNTGSTIAFSDTKTDTALIEAALNDPTLALPINNPDGSVNARRQIPPPTTKPFAAIFQDRLFLYGTTQYTVGTVGVTNNSTSVSGTGVSWPGNNEFAGRVLRVGSDTLTYTIASHSTSSITLSKAYAGTTGSGKSYVISAPTSDYRALYYSAQDEPESMPPTFVALVQENTGDNDPETGLMPFQSFLYCLHQRHLYSATFVSQGAVVITFQLVAYRGCVNNDCWVVTPDAAYLIDQQGIYSWNGASVSAISEAIQDLWIDGTLDWSTSNLWFASYEPTERVVRFYVTYVGDNVSQPIRALAFTPATNSWSTETYLFGVGAACRTDIDGQNRLILGTGNDNLLLAADGLSDIVPDPVLGNVTSATATTLVDSSGPFNPPAGVIGAPVWIISGTGAGQGRIITGQSGHTMSSGDTTLTVAAWDVTPDATSKYAVGAIPYSYMTGRREVTTTNKDQQVKRSAVLNYQPTINPASVIFQRFKNLETSPEKWQASMTVPTGVRYDAGGPNVTINLQLNQFPVGQDTGYKEVDYDAAFGGPLAAKWLAALLSGYQTLDVISLYSLETEGVTPP